MEVQLATPVKGVPGTRLLEAVMLQNNNFSVSHAIRNRRSLRFRRKTHVRQNCPMRRMVGKMVATLRWSIAYDALFPSVPPSCSIPCCNATATLTFSVLSLAAHVWQSDLYTANIWHAIRLLRRLSDDAAGRRVSDSAIVLAGHVVVRMVFTHICLAHKYGPFLTV